MVKLPSYNGIMTNDQTDLTQQCRQLLIDNDIPITRPRILLLEIHKNLISEMQDNLRYIRYLQMHKNLILEMLDNQAHINIDHRQLINIEVR